jgi:hypothetical protein
MTGLLSTCARDGCEPGRGGPPGYCPSCRAGVRALYQARVLDEAFAAYGGRCSCCGITRRTFLQLSTRRTPQPGSVTRSCAPTAGPRRPGRAGARVLILPDEGLGSTFAGLLQCQHEAIPAFGKGPPCFARRPRRTPVHRCERIRPVRRSRRGQRVSVAHPAPHGSRGPGRLRAGADRPARAGTPGPAVLPSDWDRGTVRPRCADRAGRSAPASARTRVCEPARCREADRAVTLAQSRHADYAGRVVPCRPGIETASVPASTVSGCAFSTLCLAHAVLSCRPAQQERMTAAIGRCTGGECFAVFRDLLGGRDVRE